MMHVGDRFHAMHVLLFCPVNPTKVGVGRISTRVEKSADSESEQVMAHTPGPWHVSPDGHVDNVGVYADNPTYPLRATDGEEIADFVGEVSQNLHIATVHHSTDNARLIASAPDFLKAAKDLIAYHEQAQDMPYATWLDPLRDIIARVGR
jgi:hypothetical protein